MRKKIGIFLLGMGLILSACGQKTNNSAGATESAVEEASAVHETGSGTQEEGTQEDGQQESALPNDAAQESSVQDSSENTVKGGTATELFEVHIPDKYKDLVETEASEDRVDIYLKSLRDAGYPGLIFSIWAKESPSEYAGGPYLKVGELISADGKSYDVVKGTATEAQWDFNEEMPEDFKNILETADSIIEKVTAVNGGTFMYGAGTKGEELYPYTLQTLIEALNDGADANKLEETGFSPEYYALQSGIGYAYLDVNLDGIDELFIGDMETGAVYDIFTIVDREPTHVVSGSARDRYYVYEGLYIGNEYSGGAMESGWTIYNLDSNSTDMTIQWGYKYDGYENEEKPWFKSYDLEKWESVSEDDFTEAQKKEGTYTDLSFKPLFDLAPIDFSKEDLSQYTTFTKLVDSLKPGMGYANIKLGETDVLLVSSGCYDNGDGNTAAIDSSIFMYDKDGNIVYIGKVESQGTAYPISAADGALFLAGHHFVSKTTVKDGRLFIVEQAEENFDTAGSATYTYGSDGGDLKEVPDDSRLTALFDEFEKAEVVAFQEVIK